MQTWTTNATLINPKHNLFVFVTHHNTFVAAQTAKIVAELAAKVDLKRHVICSTV